MTNTPVTDDPREVEIAPPATLGDTTQQTGRTRRPDIESLDNLIAEARAYTQASGMPVLIEFLGEDSAYVQCDRRTITVEPDPHFFRFRSRYHTQNDQLGVELGVFDTFAAAAEAPLPTLTQRTLRVTLDVVVHAASELETELSEEDDTEDHSDENDLDELTARQIAEVFEHTPRAMDVHYGDNPYDAFLAGTGILVRFGTVAVCDARWTDERSTK